MQTFVCKKQKTVPLGTALRAGACLLSFETIATSATFRVAIAGITYVNFVERTIVARTVEFTFGDVAADTFVYVHTVFHPFHLLLVFLIMTIFSLFY